MCGIVGYIGNRNARKIILDGLSMLEYRGYDSAGMALWNSDKNKIDIYKAKGMVEELRKRVINQYISNLGIGHTRWATHGKPSIVNAHPHLSAKKRFAIVHNGVAENVFDLKKHLLNTKFRSETDTEVIIDIIEKFSEENSVLDSLKKAIELIEGSYAFLFIDNTESNRIYFSKNKAPLLVGIDKEGICFSSDIKPLENSSDNYIILDDETYGYASKEGVFVFDLSGRKKDLSILKLDKNNNNIDKGSFDFYMQKEIFEQPRVVRRIINSYLSNDNMDKNYVLRLIDEADKIYIVASGSSYHAGLFGKSLFEAKKQKMTDAYIASEFAYNPPLFSKNPLFIFISQSGETADLIKAISIARITNGKIVALTNTPFSTLERLCDCTLFINALEEVSVASTKAFLAEVVLLGILSGYDDINDYLKFAYEIENILSQNDKIDCFSNLLSSKEKCIFIGRGLDAITSLESALKLKEISYMNALGISSGELKHGTIALVDDKTMIIAFISNPTTEKITRSNICEVSSRGASTIIISTNMTSKPGDDLIISSINPFLDSLLFVVIGQLISYYTAINRKTNIDKPRNLAKSVTVE